MKHRPKGFTIAVAKYIHLHTGVFCSLEDIDQNNCDYYWFASNDKWIIYRESMSTSWFHYDKKINRAKQG